MARTALNRLTFIGFAVALLACPALLTAQDTPPQPDSDTAVPEFSGSTPPPGTPPATQPATQPATEEDGDVGGDGGGFLRNMAPMLLLGGGLVLLFVFMGRGRRKQEQQRREMIANLKKGDKVTSIGGIVGTVVEVREDEITVKVDENTNTRMRFARWAVRTIGDEKTQQGQDKK